ncbi:MAG: Ferric iron ABC transporter, ATP-binding protein [uncultured Thiotrichaceae bacterium]|uniref:Ferric iron ABC transporter, ATP-binding protein n=1 Tax=uncultured Thiotrichaceae bacterium TaxID=298394 RepID=A0A6S6T6U6_9GAMM|nr:MAG: Ferric iron ABC transporter, ATP-binding protein [uncultured Thiotrichaceae bacterium]
MNTLSLENVSVHYENYIAVNNVQIQVKDGQLACLLGPSGCGKTTLLRAIAGFEKVSAGSIKIGAEVISSSKHSLPPEKRKIGMVFQDFALFPHLSIARNIAFGIRHQSRNKQKQRVKELLELVDLQGYEKRYPHELSGGQQQRIALARALAPRPKLLLLDEPFASQDVELREMLAREVRLILKKEQVTALMVTHDQHEAFAMADVIGVMKQGMLQQWDTAYHLYHVPRNQFVADFVGEGAIIKGEVRAENIVTTALGDVQGSVPDSCAPGCPVDVLIRPDDIQLVEDENQACAGETSEALVLAQVFRGANFFYTLGLQDNSQVYALAPSHQKYAVGDKVRFSLDVKHLIILKSEKAAGSEW